MKLSVFASGSSGNSLLISDLNTHIMIDAGISMRRMQECLFQNGLEWRDIGGVLITHEHSDHVSGLSAVVKKTACPLFAPHTVVNRLIGKYPQLEDRVQRIPVGSEIRIGQLIVSAFHTPHDTDESVGYRVSGSAVFAIATDMGCVTEEIRDGLRGANAVLIEANHDLALLRNGHYPVYLKRRILSDRGHLSNDACAALAADLARTGTGQIILGHLSRENNLPSLALKTVSEAVAGTKVELYCAPPVGPLNVTVGEAIGCLL